MRWLVVEAVRGLKKEVKVFLEVEVEEELIEAVD